MMHFACVACDDVEDLFAQTGYLLLEVMLEVSKSCAEVF